uniref:Glycerophosphodiester phosphodiesterase domain containing 3a n=1 Tax=Gadus morhua TaxID=8049 RepID=A0A8C5B2Y2_GADMO
MSGLLFLVFPVLGGYALTSLYLLRNPQLLHRRKRTAFHSRHISHRGGCGERIENTMEAFQKSVQGLGTELIELDCHLTADGHVIVSHDKNLLRQTGHDVDVSSLNLQDLPLYKERLEVTFNAGFSGADRKFALLEDLFRKFPRMPVNVEIKELNCRLIQKVSELVRRYGREHITVWASADHSILRTCRRENPSMPYSFSMRRGVLLLLLFYSGLLPFVPLGESFLQFYLIPKYKDSNHLRPPRLTMRPSLFRHLAARGIQVHLFVCNEERDMETALGLGATGVMTDYPTRLTNFLSRLRPQEADPR